MTDGLEQTLDAVRAALRQGDYAALAELTARMDAAATALAGTDPARLQTLRRKAEETAACLSAAKTGLRAARRRMAEVANGPAGLSTYDSSGRKSTASSGGATSRRL